MASHMNLDSSMSFFSCFCASVRAFQGRAAHIFSFPGFLKILEIPLGARHLLIREFKGTPHILGMTDKYFEALGIHYT